MGGRTMEEKDREDTVAFQLQLLSNIIDMRKYPFVKLIIDNNVTRKEYEQLLELLESLERTYLIQKEEGLLDFTSLLVHFAGMLTEKLNPNETIYALYEEEHFPSLMGEFIRLLKRNHIVLQKDGSSK